MFTNSELNQFSEDLKVLIVKDSTVDEISRAITVGEGITLKIRDVIEQAKEANRLADAIKEDKESRIVAVPDTRRDMDRNTLTLVKDGDKAKAFKTVEEAEKYISENIDRKKQTKNPDGSVTYGHKIEGIYKKAIVEVYNGVPYVYAVEKPKAKAA